MVSPEQVELVETCGCCPEQYDAFVAGKQVGYLRLRHGSFGVPCPDSDGEQVFVANSQGDGAFEDDERERYLSEAKGAIAKWVNAH